MSAKLPLDCEFHAGPSEYGVAPEAAQLRLFTNAEGITAVAWVATVAGQEITGGEALLSTEGIELVYHSVSGGPRGFGPGACELRFRLRGLCLRDDLSFRVREQRASRDDPS